LAFKHFLEIVRNGYFIKCVALTDRDPDRQSQNRAGELKTEYECRSDVIRIQITEETTFEKDLIAANKTGPGKDMLLSALQDTRPQRGKDFVDKTGANEINVDQFFNEIVIHKSEFALNLLDAINRTGNDFVIPQYIKQGFDFITK